MSISQQRFVEALEKLNAEYQLLARDVNLYKTQREEYERKCNFFVWKLNIFAKKIYFYFKYYYKSTKYKA